MPRCFGDGKCIIKGTHGYYKPFRCSYNCKLISCYSCRNSRVPQWVLNEIGICSNCLKIRRNETIMNKLFQKN